MVKLAYLCELVVFRDGVIMCNFCHCNFFRASKFEILCQRSSFVTQAVSHSIVVCHERFLGVPHTLLRFE